MSVNTAACGRRVCVCVCVCATVLVQVLTPLMMLGQENSQRLSYSNLPRTHAIQTVNHIKRAAAAVLLPNSMFLTLTHVQVELLSGMGLGFQDTNGSAGSGTLTSSGTYLTTANFTGNGSFEAAVLPSLTNTTGCGSYSNPLIELAVLVTSLDATVCCCSCCAPLSCAVLGCFMLCWVVSCCAG